MLHLQQICGEDQAVNPSHCFSNIDPTHSTETKYLALSGFNSVSSAQRLPSSLLLSATDLLLGKSATLEEKKNVKAALAFSPFHILPAKLMLCHFHPSLRLTAQPTPLRRPEKSRLQRENVINSMERQHGLSIIHVPLCRYLRLTLSPPTPSDLAKNGPFPPLVLSSSPPLRSISV